MGELLIVLVIVLLVFGANKLPQLGEGVGKAIKNFKRGINTDDDIDVTPEEKRVAASSSAETLEGEDKQSPQKKQQVQDAEVIENKS